MKAILNGTFSIYDQGTRRFNNEVKEIKSLRRGTLILVTIEEDDKLFCYFTDPKWSDATVVEISEDE